jgi:putative transcriptional regulator
MSFQSLKGRLLVATPKLRAPEFFRTVLLMLEHEEGGALAVVLNRPSDTSLDDALPGWSSRAAYPTVVFAGGPVTPESAIGLARIPPEGSGEGWDRVAGGVGVVDLNRSPEDVPGVEDVRVFAGNAGWAPGQLEMEIATGAWFVLEPDPSDAVSGAPELLWRTVLKRQPGNLSLYANFPIEPRMN